MPFNQQLRHWRDVLAGTIAVLTRSSARETSRRLSPAEQAAFTTYYHAMTRSQEQAYLAKGTATEQTASLREIGLSQRFATLQRLSMIVLFLAIVALMRPTPVPAYPGWHGNIARFHEHDVGLWRSGHWVHGDHGGRFGWWWVVDGVWYWYPTPIYPYPDPYTPPMVIQTPPLQAASPQAQASSWYYCAQPEGYYPYVAECPSGWQTMPATPSPPAGPRR